MCQDDLSMKDNKTSSKDRPEPDIKSCQDSQFDTGTLQQMTAMHIEVSAMQSEKD